MKQYLLSLLALIFSASAFSATDAVPNEAAMPSKVYYRCESQGLGFSERSLMKEVSPGHFEMSVVVAADQLNDKCVVSVVEGEVTAKEVCFVDYFPKISGRDSVAVDKSYSLQTGSSNPTFAVTYASPSRHLVTFDLNSQAFRVMAGSPKAKATLASNK